MAEAGLSAAGADVINQGTFNDDSDGDGINDSSGATENSETGGGTALAVFLPADIPLASSWALALFAAALVGLALMKPR